MSAQNGCGTATQFCTNTLDPFPAVQGATNYPVTNNNYGCLYTQPNQTWFTMTIANDGDVDFTLNNTAGIDVDFIVYGPFANNAAASAACGNLGNGGTGGAIADCSYSAAAVENVYIPDAQAGQVYVMLITNYNGGATNIYTENNVGSAAFLCDCDLDVTFGTYAGLGTGVLTSVDTAAKSAEYVVCAPVTAAGAPTSLWIDMNFTAPNATDSLSVWAAGTTVASAFPGAFNIIALPSAVSVGSLQVLIELTISHANIGDHNFVVSILTKDVTGSTCIQYIPIRVIVPGVEILAIDTTLCPAIGHTIDLSSEITTAGSAVGTGQFSWVQVTGPVTTTINTPTSENPTITIPSNTIDGQLFVYALTYTDATGCVTSDSLNIRMLDRNIDIALTADRTILCNNGEDQEVQLNIEVENNPYIIVNNGTFTWNTTQNLTNFDTYNPTATLNGTSAADSMTYILNYAYGTCTGSDTLTINFHNTSIVTIPAIDTLCLAQQVDLLTVLNDTIRTVGPDCSSYTVSNIPYAPITLATSTNVAFSASDDAYTGPLPIGFPFNFYCNDYTNIYACTNGFLSFTALTSAYITNTTIPTASTPNNILAFAWDDLYHTSSSYATIGTAPSRKFVYNYLGYRLGYSTATVNVQIILEEDTRAIEYHITAIDPNNAATLSMTQGIENSTGSAGTVVTGRNNTDFSTSNTAVRFVPRTMVVNAPITYTWTSDDVVSFNNATVNNPIGLVTGQGNVYVEVQNGDCIYRDTVVIVANDILPAPVISCGTSTNNSVQFVWDAIPGAVIYEYSLDNGATWIGVVGTTFDLGGLASGTTVDILVRGISNDGMCAIGYSSAASCTALDCDVAVNPVVTNKTGCNFDALVNNGAVTFLNVGSNQDLEYTFNGQTYTSNTIEGLDAGTYSVTVSKAGESATCFIVSTFTVADETGDVRLNPSSLGYAVDTVSVFVGDNVTLYAGYNNPATSYAWSGDLAVDPANTYSTSFLADTEGTYNFTVTANAGPCTNSDNIVVVVRNFGFTGMPTAFTPNGDGDNDIFRPVGLFGAEFKTFEVYNRWGKKVFETSDINEGWDGTIKGEPQPRDVYVYFIEFKLPSDNEPQQLRGEFTLVR